ncbi:MAG: hydroxymethylpyrimidine/phosphomethylpyrimidine kinase [Pseudomonadota bacterium]
MTDKPKPPALLIVAGLDPSGGAGLIADSQTASTLGAHAVVIATTLTVQSLQRCHASHAVSADVIHAQLNAIADDVDVRAVKIGAVPTRDSLDVIVSAIHRFEPEYVVVDPVRNATRGAALHTGLPFIDYVRRILTLNPILTPNRDELRHWLSADTDHIAKSTDATGQALIDAGCRAVLETDGDGTDQRCVHRLHTAGHIRCIEHDRVSGDFRGTGCTLSTALAALLLNGQSLDNAVDNALDFTLDAIRRAPADTGIPMRWRTS